MTLIAGVQNNTIVNIFTVDTWDNWKDFLNSTFPEYEWIPDHLLPPDFAIGWYRDSEGNWIDNDPPVPSAERAAKPAA